MDDLSKEELEQLLGVFREQALTVLEDMSQDILTLEHSHGDGEAMTRLRRSAHTIKGDSACIGLEGITEVSHRMEDLIEGVRENKLVIDASLVNVLLQALDEMRSAIGADVVRDVSPEALERVLRAIGQIEEAQQRPPNNPQGPESEPEAPESGEEQSAGSSEAATDLLEEPALARPHPQLEAEANRLVLQDALVEIIKGCIEDGRQVYLQVASRPWADAISIALGEQECPVSLLFEVGPREGSDDAGNLILSSSLAPEAMMRWLLRAIGEVADSVALFNRLFWMQSGSDGLRMVAVKRGPRSRTAARPTVVAPEASSQRRNAEYVRVEATRIDTLLNLAGEMVIARSAMNQIMPDIETAFPKNDLVARFSAASMQMGKLIAELQKSVLKMRMVMIDNVFRRFNRPMRELAAEKGKLVELEISGGETELDRTLVDLVYEPLLHLLRNAVDHGLESAEERQSAGKPRVGKITMRAYHEGNQVVVEVSDDGRGIDIARLKSKAVELGHVKQSDADHMSDDSALDLTFMPGLSTATEITTVSGRGIGASAVKSFVEELRGSLSVKTEAGVGTTFSLRMPLTLAIIKALLFNVCGQTFALPLLVVSEVARVKDQEMIYLDEFESFRLRDRFLSVVRPGRVFGFDRRVGGKGAAMRGAVESFFVIVVTAGGRRFGIAADSLIGEQELVIKPLDAEWVQNEALAGASLLGDGRVVLILDAGAVFRKALKWEHSRGLVQVGA
jgi:two-component system chemotaxis sensor kinase CheA